MKIRGSTRAVLWITAIVLLCVPTVVAQRSFAQGATTLEPTGGGAGTPSSPASSSSGTGAGDSAEKKKKTDADSDAMPPGTEIRVVVGGESEAAAAYSAGDSVTGFDAADMEAIGALSIADLAGFTPNLEIVTTGATTPTFFIRGVGLNDFSANASGAVAIFQDDVNINAPAMQLGTIFDMENVVIQRGPVGTGAARNASAGAIRLFSRKPRGSYNGFLRSTFGNYNFNDFEGAIEAPMYEDILSGRIAFRSSFRDGFQTNGCGGMTAYPGFNPGGTNQNEDSPLWSYCGESVPPPGTDLGKGNGVSTGFTPLPLNLPTKVNNLGTWATRATLRFQPTLDQDWLINGHVANRDEYSRLGIQYGTGGQQIYPDGSTVDGILGGPQGAGATEFVRPQVTEMIRQLTQLYRIPLAANCPPAPANCRNRDFAAAGDAAPIAVANQIGASLDTDPYTGYYNKVGDTTNLVYGGYVNGEIALPDEMVFKTVSGYDAYDRGISTDTDQSPQVLVEIESKDRGWQFYQNFDLSGALDVEPIEWNVGGYLLQEDLFFESDVDFGRQTGLGIGNRKYTQTATSFGIYAGGEWSFWDDFTLNGGIRYNWEDKFIDYYLETTGIPVTADRTEIRSAPTGEARLTYNFTQDAHAYWKYSRGWKGGQFNATGSLTDGVTYAEPEENNAYETGFRAAWFDNRVGLDMSLFYYDYSNYQLFTVQNSAGATPEFVVINASDVQVYGSEVTLDTRPWDNTRLQARFGWLESYFIDFVNKNFVFQEDPAGGPQVRRVRDIDYSGNRLVNSPQFKISLTAEQTVQLGRYGALTARYDTAWTDTTYFDPSEGRGLPNTRDQYFLPADTIGQQPYWLHNLLFIYRPPTGNVTLELFVRNVSDEVYRTFSFDATVFARTTIHYTGEPRMFGGTLSVNF